MSHQPNQDGFYEQLRKAKITISKSKRSERFKNLFKASNIEINQVVDFKTENWKKVCESSVLGAILCLSGETCWIFEDKNLRKLYLDILKECLMVAIADGAKIAIEFEDEMILKLHSYAKTKGSSMLTDRINGNPIEIGAKNKIISEIGKQYNIQTPLNDLIVALLSQTNKRQQTTPYKNYNGFSICVLFTNFINN